MECSIMGELVLRDGARGGDEVEKILIALNEKLAPRSTEEMRVLDNCISFDCLRREASPELGEEVHELLTQLEPYIAKPTVINMVIADEEVIVHLGPGSGVLAAQQLLAQGVELFNRAIALVQQDMGPAGDGDHRPFREFEVLVQRAYWHSGRFTVQARDSVEAERKALVEIDNVELDLDSIFDGHDEVHVVGPVEQEGEGAK